MARQLIDQGKVDMDEIALEMGILPTSLVATVAVINYFSKSLFLIRKLRRFCFLLISRMISL